MFLGLILESEEFVRIARRETEPSDFKNVTVRGIVERLFEKESGEPASVSRLMTGFQDDPEAARVLSLASAETETVGDRRKAFEDCISKLRRSRAQARRAAIRSEIAVAETQGDRNRIHQLLRTLDELNKGIRHP